MAKDGSDRLTTDLLGAKPGAPKTSRFSRDQQLCNATKKSNQGKLDLGLVPRRYWTDKTVALSVAKLKDILDVKDAGAVVAALMSGVVSEADRLMAVEMAEREIEASK